ncbi:MAG: COX15/CtaA family protein [Pseudomonadota bacterium]
MPGPALDALTLPLMAVTALLVAALPLLAVWRSRDTNKFRKLVWVGVFLTFDLVVFGAFTRLTDSGLGCPDWPGCYGQANPLLAHAQIAQAAALMPSGPVTLPKAWIEMIHRFLASGIGALIVVLMGWAWYRWKRAGGVNGSKDADEPWLPSALFALVCLQGAFGAWTVTLKLQPMIVTIHLLLGMALLALLAWLGARQDALSAHTRRRAGDRAVARPLRTLQRLALLSACLLAAQVALGGWVSTNYAALACQDFPLCGGRLVPEMDFAHGFALWRQLGMTASGQYLPFPALTAIHWVHRNAAFLVFAVLGATVWRAWVHVSLRPLARKIALLLVLQAGSGIATIFLSWPLAIAVLHNAGAAALVVLVTMLNYAARHPSGAASASLPPSPSKP